MVPVGCHGTFWRARFVLRGNAKVIIDYQALYAAGLPHWLVCHHLHLVIQQVKIPEQSRVRLCGHFYSRVVPLEYTLEPHPEMFCRRLLKKTFITSLKPVALSTSIIAPLCAGEKIVAISFGVLQHCGRNSGTYCIWDSSGSAGLELVIEVFTVGYWNQKAGGFGVNMQLTEICTCREVGTRPIDFALFGVLASSISYLPMRLDVLHGSKDANYRIGVDCFRMNHQKTKLVPLVSQPGKHFRAVPDRRPGCCVKSM